MIALSRRGSWLETTATQPPRALPTLEIKPMRRMLGERRTQHVVLVHQGGFPFSQVAWQTGCSSSSTKEYRKTIQKQHTIIQNPTSTPWTVLVLASGPSYRIPVIPKSLPSLPYLTHRALSQGSYQFAWLIPCTLTDQF